MDTMPRREQSEIYDVNFLKGFIRRRKKLFFTVSSVIFGASVLFASFFAAKVYVSSATVLVEGKSTDDVRRGLTAGHIEERLQSITQQLLSRDKLLEIIRQYDLYDTKDQTSAENAIRTMKENILVRTIKAEDLDKRPSLARLVTVAFTLSFQGKDPETVQKVASRLASLYVEKNEQVKDQMIAQKTAVLEQKLQQTKEEAESLGKKLSDFKRQNAGGMPESIPLNLEQIYRLNAQLEEVNNKINALEDRVRSAEVPFGASSVQAPAGSGQPASDPWTRLAQLRMQLQNLRARYSEKHPDVIKTRSEIQHLEGMLGVSGGQGNKAASNARESELKKYVKQRDDIQRKIAELTRRNQMGPMIQTELNRLSADYDNMMKQYADARMKLSETKAMKEIDETLLGDRFIIIDQPIVPQKPDNPRHGKILLAGIFLSIFCGLFASILAENLDNSIKSAEHLQRITKVPVLTIVPLMKSDEEKAASGHKQMVRMLEDLKRRARRVVSKNPGS